MRFAVRRRDAASPALTMIVRVPIAMAVRSTGGNPGEVLGEPALDRPLIPSPGEPLPSRPTSRAELLVRPFYSLKVGEPGAIELAPNRHGHREAT